MTVLMDAEAFLEDFKSDLKLSFFVPSTTSRQLIKNIICIDWSFERFFATFLIIKFDSFHPRHGSPFKPRFDVVNISTICK